MISAGLQAQAQLSTTLTAKMAGGLAKLCHSETLAVHPADLRDGVTIGQDAVKS
jgi:hypothetical protein